MQVSAELTSTDQLTEASVQAFRDNGFLRIPGLLAPAEAARYAEVVGTAVQEESAADLKPGASPIFSQFVNLWTVNEEVRSLSMHPRLVGFIKQLAGDVPVRYWHDHALIKYPGKNKPTEFHQDEPYWPHENSRFACAAWIALVDVPARRGCMSYIPGYHLRKDLGRTNLADGDGLFGICPELEYEPITTVPLKAGDCTVHHCRCPHAAGANITDDPRIAHISMFVDAAATYNGTGHVVTDGLGLTEGAPLEHDLFPAL